MEYVIQKGDTLSSIAKRYGVSVNKLAEDNDIKDINKIYAGRSLSIDGTSNTQMKKTSPTENKTQSKMDKDQILKYYIDQMVASGNKKIFVTDKGTKTTYYGNSADYKGDINNLQKIPVLTGKNDNPNAFVNARLGPDTIETMPDPKKYQVTPVAKFAVSKNPNIYGVPGLSLQGSNTAYHTLYPGELTQRMKALQSPTLKDNNLSYGCINCKKPDAEALYNYFETGDSTYIIDSRLSIPEIDANMEANKLKLTDRTAPNERVEDIANKLAVHNIIQQQAQKKTTVNQNPVRKSSGMMESPYEMGGYINIDEERELAKDGIHIKPSHRGRFTAYLKRTGKTLTEALHSKDPHVRKMANFARNAKKWKHEDGGKVKDRLSEDIFEVVDPTGISSYDDVYRAWTDGKFDYQDIVEPLGALPLVGKFGKLEKAMKVGTDLFHEAKASKMLGTLNKVMTGENAYEATQRSWGGRAKAEDGELVIPSQYNSDKQGFNWYTDQPMQNPYAQPGFDVNSNKIPVYQMQAQGNLDDVKRNAEAAKGVTESSDGKLPGITPGQATKAAGQVALGIVDTFTAMGNQDKPFNAAMTAGSTAVRTTDQILAPLDAIPGAQAFTAPIKALSFGIGALVGGFKKKIENTEQGKAEALTEYYDRNMPAITATRGNGKYGIGVSSQPLEEEIFADFDQLMKNRK